MINFLEKCPQLSSSASPYDPYGVTKYKDTYIEITTLHGLLVLINKDRFVYITKDNNELFGDFILEIETVNDVIDLLIEVQHNCIVKDIPLDAHLKNEFTVRL